MDYIKNEDFIIDDLLRPPCKLDDNYEFEFCDHCKNKTEIDLETYYIDDQDDLILCSKKCFNEFKFKE